MFCVCVFSKLQNMQKTALETLHDKAPELLPQQGIALIYGKNGNGKKYYGKNGNGRLGYRKIGQRENSAT